MYVTDQACREAGKTSIEGKNYIVNDGDVIFSDLMCNQKFILLISLKFMLHFF